MSSSERSATEPFLSSRLVLIVASLLSATALAGCSADLARFDMASASFNSDAPRARTAPTPSEGLRRGGEQPLSDAVPPPPSQPYSYSPAPYAPPAPVRQAGLPEPIMRDAPPPRRGADQPRREATAPRAPIAHARAGGGDTAGQRTIDVQQGDTIYGLAKRHKVSISELMSANNLSSPMIRPGQKLALPGAARSVPRKREAVASAPALPPPARTIAPAPIASSETASDWTGSHTVSPRDTLSTIARRYNIKAAELQAANGIADPTKVRAGTVLKVPGGAGRGVASAAPEAMPNGPAEGSVASSAPIARPTIINAPQSQPAERIATVNPPNPTLTDAAPEPVVKPVPTTKAQPVAAGPMKFRWPAKGRVVANFGPRSDNTHNDGINILVPQGTEVMAAEAGTVAYAGSELKGYGNLVLIRHEGNWVSAYAHNDTLLVKRGDKVERGQAVAKAGKTGAVDQPQVHFELRQGSKPIDPVPHLEK